MTLPRAIAAELSHAMDSDGFPWASAWETAPTHTFCAEWQGKNPDAQRETQVQLLWTHENLYVHFRCRYRELTVFPDSEPNGRRDHLWDRDVAEIFLQPDASRPLHYLEFEVSPIGQWIALAIDRTTVPHKLSDLRCELRRRVSLNEHNRSWTAALVIPMSSLVNGFDPNEVWRVNFFRVEGKTEPRFYSTWSPTKTPTPNFHVPEAFGELVFSSAAAPRSA